MRWHINYSFFASFGALFFFFLILPAFPLIIVEFSMKSIFLWFAALTRKLEQVVLCLFTLYYTITWCACHLLELLRGGRFWTYCSSITVSEVSFPWIGWLSALTRIRASFQQVRADPFWPFSWVRLLPGRASWGQWVRAGVVPWRWFWFFRVGIGPSIFPFCFWGHRLRWF